jgi:hypothetical protein
MIRNKRTTFAACIDTVSPFANRSTVPRLAGPIPDDATPFCLPTESLEFIRRSAVLPDGTRNAGNAAILLLGTRPP